MPEDFLLKFRESYLHMANAQIKTMNDNLLALEKNPDDTKLIHEIFRAAHTLKSNAATMTYHQTSQLCHALEDLLEALRNKLFSLDKITNLLFECIDFLRASLKEVSSDNKELDADPLIQKIRFIIENPQHEAPSVQSEQKIISAAVEKIQTIDVKVERLDILMKLAEELLVNRLKLDLLSESINHPDLRATVDTLGRMVTEIQYNIMQARMLPIKFIFDRFPRMVRDLAKKEHKEIELQIEGGDIELDRTLLDEIAGSLAHLIRNAIDHGIEAKDVRQRVKKNPQGIIRLIATRTKEFVTIEISDDGAGLDLKGIEIEAIKRKILKPGATDDELMNVIFEGVTTTKEVTDVSGRGLGLSIVKQKIESIGGGINVKSDGKSGTSFFIKIPLTLAVIKVLFVKVCEKIYAIPLDNIERLLTLSEQDFKGLLNYQAIIYENENIPITHLSMLFNKKISAHHRQPIVVVRNNEARLGIAVDQLLSTQEVVIKPLGKVVKKNKFFSGSALIGSGEVVLIIDVANLFLSKKQTPFPVVTDAK